MEEKKGILVWEKPSHHEQVFTTSESYTEEMLKWKAKLIVCDDTRVEIRKTFQWFSNDNQQKGYTAQLLIVVRMNPKDEPDIVISANGKVALSNTEMIMVQMAIEEAKLMLSKLKEHFPIKKKKIVSKK